MQTEKRQPSGQRIMPEMSFIEFPALSFDPRVGISLSASKTDDRFYLSASLDKQILQSHSGIPAIVFLMFPILHVVVFSSDRWFPPL